MGLFLRQTYKQKPQSYGPPSQVHSSIFANAEREGYDPGSIALAMPMWGPGLNVDYGRYLLNASTNNFSFAKNSFIGDGDGDGINLPSGFEPIRDTPTFTIISKVKIDSVPKDTGLFYTNTHQSGQPVLFWGDKAATNKFAAIITTNSSTTGAKYSGETISLGKEYFLCLVYDGAHVRLYINGIEDIGGGFPASISGASKDIISTTGYTVGAVSDRTFNGQYDFFLLSLTAYTPSQIAYLSDNPYFLLHPRPSVFYSVPSGAITLRQFGFRFRNDDGNESAATWNAAENTNVSLAPGSKFRIRLGIVKE